MYRPYLTLSTKQLLEIARSPSCTIAVLEDIMNELAQRKNDYAFYAIFEIGKLLEQAKEKEMRREIEERKQIESHSSIRHNQDGFFEWPSTSAPASKYGFIGDVFFYKEGLLSYVGYRVGQQGLPSHVRLQILDCVFHNILPRVDSHEYMNEWGMPKTAARLHKLAETLAAFTRNAKRRMKHSNLSKAIADWETDLNYLYRQYYIGKFGFAWPLDE